jgi:hypothetical protein
MTTAAIYTPRDQRNYQVFVWWLAGAMLSFGTATILIGEKLIEPGPVAWALTVFTIVLMMLTVRAYMHFLRNADELLHKIHLEALGLAFGAGFVWMMGYRLCERLGAPKLDVNDSFLVMGIIWGLAQWLGIRRYSAEEGEGQ